MGKFCKKCNKRKTFSEFERLFSGKVSENCNNCKKLIEKEQKEEYFEKEFLRKVRQAYKDQKKNSKKRGHKAPEYTLDELIVWCREDINYMGLIKAWIESEKDFRKVPVIDRIDNNKGYSFSNIQSLTMSKNSSKGNKPQHLLGQN